MHGYIQGVCTHALGRQCCEGISGLGYAAQGDVGGFVLFPMYPNRIYARRNCLKPITAVLVCGDPPEFIMATLYQFDIGSALSNVRVQTSVIGGRTSIIGERAKLD